MTDVTTSLLPAGRPTAEETARRTRSRNAAETRFKAYGIAAIAIESPSSIEARKMLMTTMMIGSSQ